MKEPNFYAAGGIDRAGHHRKDKAWLADRLADPSSRFLPVWRSQNLIIAAESARPRAALLARQEIAAEGETVLLSLIEDCAYFVVDLSALEAPLDVLRTKAPAAFTDLRRIGPLLGRLEGALLAYARGIAYWHGRHRFCGICGSATVSEEGGHVRRCTNPSCNAQHFPRTDPAVIMLVHDGERCLLGRQRAWPTGMHSTLAGFVEPGESLEEAVAREVFEETGIGVDEVAYHSSQPWPFPSSIMLGFHARARDREIRVDHSELQDARWFERSFILAHQDDDAFRLPRRDSIARRLIEDWLRR
ncbi:MAG TPA: NAD(+) diphosphatase [Stellaceae bacterium]|jgi:NAD+ diphosphatase|nr:NAD(+) diphosphatase [Stellaceae bacterium]